MKMGKIIFSFLILFALVASASAVEMQPYQKDGQLTPMPAGKASLYTAPWRSNVQTVSAYDALQGVGLYYKHMPPWNEAQNTLVMKQLAAAGIKRVRLAPHYTIYMHDGWTGPDANQLATLRAELRACHAAGIRPCVTFVHIPPVGKPGTDELNKWWKRNWNNYLPKQGEVGSPEFKKFVDMTYLGLSFILKEARDAGFTEPGSYDIEMGQGLWWGAPAIGEPMPADVDALKPGKRIYEFEKEVMEKARKAGFNEPLLWTCTTIHRFDECDDTDVPDVSYGRAISFYTQGIGPKSENFLKEANDLWPVREPYTFVHKEVPDMVMARPEGWMADYSRHDNLIAFMKKAGKPVTITSLGIVPKTISGYENSPFDGWQMKERGITRTLSFWLNQGSPFLLIHSAYEHANGRNGELEHSLIPGNIQPETFRWQDAPPLRTLKAWCDGLAGASRIDTVTDLSFKFALSADPVLVPKAGEYGPMKASDLIALLPYQINEKEYAVAAYICTPDITKRMEPLELTLEINKKIDSASVLRPYNGMKVTAQIVGRTNDSTTLKLFVYDDASWIRFKIQ